MTREEEAAKAAYKYIETDLKGRYTVDFEDIDFAFQSGVEWADNHPYWRPATEHPDVDVEVIALVGKYLKVVFAHIVKDREKVVDYDGWNIPEVKWWMPIQSIGELEENEQ